MEDDTWLPEGERSYDDEGEGKNDDSADEQDSEEEPHEEEEEAADLAALVAIGGHGDTEDVRSRGYEDVEDVRSCGEPPSISCATKSEALAESQTPIGVLERPCRPSRKWERRHLLRTCRTQSERRSEGRVLPAERTKT